MCTIMACDPIIDPKFYITMDTKNVLYSFLDNQI